MELEDGMKLIITNTPRPGESPTARDRPTLADLLDERGKTHGDFADHAQITQSLKDILRAWYTENHTFEMRESLEMQAHKWGRILAGDPDFRDHWDDIAGYAKLVADRCSK